MANFRRKTPQSNINRALSVARTVETPQRDFEDFLNAAGRELGQIATVRTITSTRITIIESRDAQKAMRRSRMNAQAAREFSSWMSDNLCPPNAVKIGVKVNRERPLRLMGRNLTTLVLNIIPDDRLINERQSAECLLEGRFGGLPDLVPFEPHITIGDLKTSALSDEEKKNPQVLLPAQFAFPHEITLNGLSVFIGGRAPRP